MSRRKITEEKININEIIPLYKEEKDKENKAKKVAGKYGDEIKKYLQEHNLTSYEVGEIKASISVTPKEEFNEEKAIEILRKELSPVDFARVVKTKEYIDDDVFESMEYLGEIDASILSPAITPLAPTVRLTIGKAKKNEDN